jgi:hypothetical protein
MFCTVVILEVTASLRRFSLGGGIWDHHFEPYPIRSDGWNGATHQ